MRSFLFCWNRRIKKDFPVHLNQQGEDINGLDKRRSVWYVQSIK